MRIVVCDAQYRMALAVIRELGQAGHTVVAVGGKDAVGFASRYTSQAVIAPPEDDDYRALLHAQDGVLFPTGARTLALPGICDRAMTASPTVLAACNDKEIVEKTAQSLGIPVPGRWQGSFPAVLKYRNGEALGLAAHKRYVIAHDRGQLETACAAMEAVQPNVLVQPYIPGPSVGVSALMDRRHRPLRIFCHERIRQYPLSGGPSTACRSVWPRELIQPSVKLLQALEFVGFAMVEWKGGHVLEINPRIWGSYPLARLAGADLACAYVRAAAGEPLECVLAPTYRLNVRMQFWLSDTRAALHSLTKGNWAAVAGYVGDSLSPRTGGGLFDRRDMRPVLRYVRNGIG